MTTTIEQQIEEIVAATTLGTPSARKTGRHPEWPYVPVYIAEVPGANGRTTQHQILGLAYATRTEAFEAAERHIESWKRDLARKLADPAYRALRQQYGLPREIR